MGVGVAASPVNNNRHFYCVVFHFTITGSDMSS